MKDKDKTKAQLVNELAELRQRIAELEASEAERKRAEEALQFEREQLLSIFDSINEAIYVADPNTYELLYVNKALRYAFQKSLVGGICYREFQGFDSPCEFCTNEIILKEKGKPYQWEYHNPILNRDYTMVDRVIKWPDGRDVRFEFAMDITERKRAEEALRRSLEETARSQRLLLALSQAAQAVQRARTPDEVYRTVADEVTKLGYHAVVFTLTDDRAHLAVSHTTFEPAALRAAEKLTGLSVQGFRFPLVPDGFYQRIIAEGETTFAEPTAELIAESLPVPLRPLAGRVAAMLGLEQAIYAPLTAGGETQGLLIVAGAGLTEADVPAVTAFANQAAIALESARLYQAERKRASQLAVVNQVARQAASILDMDQLLPEVVAAIQQGFDYYHVGLFLLDELAGELEIRAIAGGFEDVAPPDHRLALGEGMAGWTAETGQSLLANDVSQEPRYVLGILKEALTKAELCVPLKLAGKVIGVLDIQSSQLNAFDETDLMAMETLADQLAVAIENAQLYQETVRRLKEAETLSAVTTTLTRSLDLDQVLQSIVDSATRLIPASTVGVIHLVDEATGKLIPRATFVPELNTQKKLEMSIGEGIAGLVMQEKRLINVPNVEEDPRFLTADTASPNKSLLTAPLLMDKDCIGTLSLNSDQVGAFSAGDEWLLTTLAAQAAVAVKNARLFEQALQDAKTKTTLLQEVNHRVKNNLSAIVGLLYVERRHAAIKDQALYQSIIQNMSNRVQGLATVHSLLSDSGWAPLSLSELTAQIIRSSLQMLPRHKSISVDVTPSPVRVTPDQAHDLALVINELGTNTVKHALEERDTAHITVCIGLDDGTVLFEFRDDGPGYPEEVLQLERHNVGFYLIQRFVLKSLRGELALHNDRGAVTTIRFKQDLSGF